MKTLTLVRHAKSSWSMSDLPDIDRPLNDRGYRDAHDMSKQYSEKEKCPELIVSSPACRAITTALIFSRTLKYPCEQILIRSKLYETTGVDYFNVVGKTDDVHSSLLLFGHNFTISEFAASLLGTSFDEMPTCAIFAVQIPITSWKHFKAADKKFLFFKYPKEV